MSSWASADAISLAPVKAQAAIELELLVAQLKRDLLPFRYGQAEEQASHGHGEQEKLELKHDAGPVTAEPQGDDQADLNDSVAMVVPSIP